MPGLNRKSPSTSFKIRGQDFHVDLLTPLHGPDSATPVRLQHFNSYAHPVRFLDFLLEDPQIAVIPFRGGILVNVPLPAQFAVHKLVVSQCRSVAKQVKASKDLLQAAMMIELLLEDRPGDLWCPWTPPGKCRLGSSTNLNKDWHISSRSYAAGLPPHSLAVAASNCHSTLTLANDAASLADSIKAALHQHTFPQRLGLHPFIRPPLFASLSLPQPKGLSTKRALTPLLLYSPFTPP